MTGASLRVCALVQTRSLEMLWVIYHFAYVYQMVNDPDSIKDYRPQAVTIGLEAIRVLAPPAAPEQDPDARGAAWRARAGQAGPGAREVVADAAA